MKLVLVGKAKVVFAQIKLLAELEAKGLLNKRRLNK